MSEAEAKIMYLTPRHIEALDKAETLIAPSDFSPYLELKALLPDPSPPARDRFRRRFASFYGLNRGGLTNEFKDRFFEILFDGKVIVEGRPDFASILTELSRIKRRKGDLAMPFSFVSKLVAMHLESSPIYDRHVRAFFGKAAPPASVENDERIKWYLAFLGEVGRSYTAWAGDPQVRPILERLIARDDGLKSCHVVRLLDFLVWKVGNRKLLKRIPIASAGQTWQVFENLPGLDRNYPSIRVEFTLA
jgi:hypothetical protein